MSEHLATSEQPRAARPRGEAYRDTTHRAPLCRVIERENRDARWAVELLACGHRALVYRVRPATATRRCLECAEER